MSVAWSWGVQLMTYFRFSGNVDIPGIPRCCNKLYLLSPDFFLFTELILGSKT